MGLELVSLPVRAHPVPGKQDVLIEDIPEEVLVTEIILEARSPLNGEPLSAAEYAQLQDELHRSRKGEVPGRLAPKIHRAVFLFKTP